MNHQGRGQYFSCLRKFLMSPRRPAEHHDYNWAATGRAGEKGTVFIWHWAKTVAKKLYKICRMTDIVNHSRLLWDRSWNTSGQPHLQKLRTVMRKWVYKFRFKSIDADDGKSKSSARQLKNLSIPQTNLHFENSPNFKTKWPTNTLEAFAQKMDQRSAFVPTRTLSFPQK